jgi:hypothetical protein
MVKIFMKWISLATCFAFIFSIFLVGLIIYVCAFLDLSLNEFNFIMDIFKHMSSLAFVIFLILTSKNYFK